METAGVYRATVHVQMYMCQMLMYMHTCIVKGWSLQYAPYLKLRPGHWPKTAFDTAQLPVTLLPWQKSAVTVRRFGRIWRNTVSYKYSTLLESQWQLSLWYFFEWPLLDSVMFHAGHRNGTWRMSRVMNGDRRNLQTKATCWIIMCTRGGCMCIHV